MRLDPIYDDSTAESAGGDPDGIKVTGTSREFEQVGPLPSHHNQYPTSVPTSGSWAMPAERALVHHIAKLAEVELEHQGLIDWMARGDPS